MGVVEVDISMSVDGFITGPNLNQYPSLGRDGEILHARFRRDPDGPRLIQDALVSTSGAVVTSRKVYDGTGEWGDDGFYRMPVFVLTHRPYDVVVKGETTFTFLTGGIDSAITKARAVAGEVSIRHPSQVPNHSSKRRTSRILHTRSRKAAPAFIPASIRPS